MNVAARMEPSMRYSYNVRSFFIEDDQDARTGDLRNGLRLWHGYLAATKKHFISLLNYNCLILINIILI